LFNGLQSTSEEILNQMVGKSENITVHVTEKDQQIQHKKLKIRPYISSISYCNLQISQDNSSSASSFGYCSAKLKDQHQALLHNNVDTDILLIANNKIFSPVLETMNDSLEVDTLYT